MHYPLFLGHFSLNFGGILDSIWISVRFHQSRVYFPENGGKRYKRSTLFHGLIRPGTCAGVLAVAHGFAVAAAFYRGLFPVWELASRDLIHQIKKQPTMWLFVLYIREYVETWLVWYGSYQFGWNMLEHVETCCNDSLPDQDHTNDRCELFLAGNQTIWWLSSITLTGLAVSALLFLDRDLLRCRQQSSPMDKNNFSILVIVVKIG